MSEKQKPETAETPASLEVNDETLDQINGGFPTAFSIDAPDNIEPAWIKIARN